MTFGALLRQAKALIDIGRLSCRADWSVFVGGHVAVAWHSMVVAWGSNSPSGKLRRPTPRTPDMHATVVLSPYYCSAPFFYCGLVARAVARGKPISNPSAMISHNFRCAAFGIFLLLLKGNRAAGTHCLLMAAPAG